MKYYFQDGGDTSFFNMLADYAANQQAPQAQGTSDPTTPTVPDDINDYDTLNNNYTDLQSKYSDLQDRLSKVESNLGGYSGDDEFMNFILDDTNDKAPLDFANFTPKALNSPVPLRKGFQSFVSPQQGRTALENQLRLYQTGQSKNPVHPNSTLAEAMAVYAPSSDNNNPKHYADFIANKLGVSPNTPISQVSTKDWADAITQFEGNKSGNNPGNLRTFQVGGANPGYHFDFDQQKYVPGNLKVPVEFSNGKGTDGRSYYDPIENKINLNRDVSSETINHEKHHAEQNRQGEFSEYRSAPLNTDLLSLLKEAPDQKQYEDLRYGRRDADINRISNHFEGNFKHAYPHDVYPDYMKFAGLDAQKSYTEQALQYEFPSTAEGDAQLTEDQSMNPLSPITDPNIELQFRKFGGKKMQNGGANPIYTQDKNDPRIRNYQDSLNLYKYSNNVLDKFNKVRKIDNANSSDSQRPYIWENESQDIHNWEVYNQQSAQNSFYRLLDINKSAPSPINPLVGDIRNESDGKIIGNLNLAQFKKPSQPIIYRPQQPLIQKDTTQFPLLPIGDQSTGILQPNLPPPTFGPVDPKTNFSAEVGPHDARRVQYFPDADSWQQYVDSNPYISQQINGNRTQAQATMRQYGGADDVSRQGYNYNSPYRDEKSLLINTPTGNITMENTHMSLLGIDNLGNRKVMKPGGKYQFPGNQVKEIPMTHAPSAIHYQVGGNVADTPKNKYQDFYDNYINSDGYKSRLAGQGYDPVQVAQVIADRTKSINNTSVQQTSGRSKAIDPNVIAINPKEGDASFDEIASHEYSHKAGAGAPDGDPNLTLNSNELDMLNSLNKAGSRANEHIKNPYEAKADLDAFRFLMNDIKKPDTPTTQEDLDKARQSDVIKNSVIDRRLKKRYSDPDLLKLLNGIAVNQTPISSTAKYGI